MAVGGYHSQENVHGFFQPGSVDAYDICNVVSQAVFEDPNLSPDVPGLIAVVSLGSVLFAIAGKRQQVNYLRNGYLLLDTAQITDAWTQFRPTICEQIARKLGAVLAHSIDRVGDLVLSLAGIGGVSWPRTPSPIVFHAAPEVIGIDMYAASERFLKRLQYLPLQGDIANFQSFHFGNAVQDIIDASSWRPSDELRALVGEQERG